MSTEDPPPRGFLARLAAMVVAVRALRRGDSSTPTLEPPAPESDVDLRRRVVPGNRRAETVVAGLLLTAGLCGLGFTAVYAAAGGNTQLLGLTLGLVLGLLAAACIVAGKAVVPQETAVEERDKLLDEEQTE